MGISSRFVLGVVVVLLAACSSNPPPEDASNKADGAGATADAPEPPPTSNVDLGDTSTPQAAATVVSATGVKRTDDGSIPDDYQLLERDCVDLGKKLGELWAVDLRAGLSPKLTAKQREKAEESIVEGSTKKANDWADGCIKSLAGKSVDPKALKCAFDSKDLKAFEACLN